jgi:serine/threonine protein phosphatase PrpC
MATDGVTETGEGNVRSEWIKGAIEESSDVESLAESIVQSAARRCGGEYRDDMTVAAIKIKRIA